METVVLLIRSDGKFWHGRTEEDVASDNLVNIVGMMEPMPQEFDQMCQMMTKMMGVSG